MSKSKFRVLLIDDSPEDRDMYRRYLCDDQECEYSFAEADMGAEGLQSLAKEKFDCVLLDYQLPDFNGVDFLKKANEQLGLEHAPIVMITGRGDERIAVQALKLGASDYFVKSNLTPESIYRATRNAIEKREQRLKLAAETENLRVTQEHLTLLVEGARDYAMVLLDRSGLITQWNRGAHDLTGYTSAEAIGQNFEILFEARDRARGIPNEELERARRGKRLDVERWMLRKDGQRFWATGSVSLLYASNGNVRGFAKILRDGTQRKHFDEERANEGRWFESLLDFLPIAVVLIEPRTGRMRFANKSAHDMAGGTFVLAESYEDYAKIYQSTDSQGRPYAIDQLPSVRAARGEKVKGAEMSWLTQSGKQSFLVDASLMAPLSAEKLSWLALSKMSLP